MKPIGTSRLLMPPGLEELHHESVAWISEGRFCVDELNFFTKLLDVSETLAQTDADKEKMEYMVAQVNFFRETALPRMLEDLNRHEKYLSGLLQRQSTQTEIEAYRIAHRDHAENARETYSRFKILKQELYSFIEEIIDG